MAKKKKKSAGKKKAPINTGPKHVLPDGFWAQVGAVLLIVFSLLIILGWFGLGGPVLDWLNEVTVATIGYGVYVVPVVFIYVAIEIFRAEDNRIPFVMKLATAVELIWVAGLFGLLKNAEGETTGGFVGDAVNSGMLMLVEPGVAAFIYVILILLTALFITRTSPFTIIKKLWEMTRRDNTEQEENVKVMRNAATLDTPKKGAMSDFTVNAGVSTLDPAEATGKKSAHLGSLKNSVTKDKAAEDQAALVAVSDPNWKSPGLDLLEKKQSPADAGDVQQNAQTIKDTLAEFNISRGSVSRRRFALTCPRSAVSACESKRPVRQEKSPAERRCSTTCPIRRGLPPAGKVWM